MTIYFYRERDKPYGCFSNFSKHSFELDGQPWQTVEHYFQAMKFAGTPRAYEIQFAKAPMEAKVMGNDRAYPIRDDWEQVKDDLMRRAVLAKFQTHADIREILLSTGSEELVEDAPNDYYRGCGKERTGKNMLGKILMETREKLRRE
ncbi:MAG: NADAR family protein [Armatimonadetes bacterium]|nr:NADAR family protein [Armatimonadota bacterium]